MLQTIDCPHSLFYAFYSSIFEVSLAFVKLFYFSMTWIWIFNLANKKIIIGKFEWCHTMVIKFPHSQVMHCHLLHNIAFVLHKNPILLMC